MSDFAAVVSPATVRRPILIDERDGPCELCVQHKAGYCDSCELPIPVYENMGGNGYQSVLPSHFHLEMIEGFPGRRSKHTELCFECYHSERKLVYPNEYQDQ